jgi:hypothetical protein
MPNIARRVEMIAFFRISAPQVGPTLSSPTRLKFASGKAEDQRLLDLRAGIEFGRDRQVFAVPATSF